mmetsp:Transcript_52946/g.138854  ORF Transcript_52946/g.138854 Transcript_52946/m.138854 type:complete len:254 (-) Transcript_52946:351-1112(-)
MPPKWLADLNTWLDSSEVLDSLPVASQGKSVVQVLSGNTAAAAQTQEKFSRRCVGVSQLRQMVERRSGNEAAAAQTQAEFSTALRNTPMAIGSLISEGVSAAEQAAQRFRRSELGGQISRGAEGLAQQGVAAADRLAQQLTESDLPRRFADLVEQVVPAQFRGEGGGSSGLSTHGGGAGSGLDSYTLLTKVAPSQTSTQCPCCMENFGEGEMMRVLPCFHALHQQCADNWLHTNPICPVCRCDIRASLENHRR